MKIVKVKVPGPMRMVWGTLVAYWLSGVINPAFVAIAVMVAMYIPILIIDPYFPSEAEEVSSSEKNIPVIPGESAE